MESISKPWLALMAATTLAAATMTMVGCQEATDDSPGAETVSGLPPDTVDAHDHAEHAHPSEGPHHGDLVELGNEEFHAEVVHSEDSGSLTVYILDSSATKPVAIDAADLTINVTHDGKPEQFVLAAKADDGDEAGKSSRFVSEDKELAAHLDEEGTSPKLVVKIDGKVFRGEIVHNHEGHDHDHGHAH